MFCRKCGAEINDDAVICVHCGCATSDKAASKKSNSTLNGQDKTLLGILAILFGGLGIHNFMLGETKKGIIRIVFYLLCGIGAIFGLIDGIMILTDKYVVNPESYFF